jgi:hypothetical protein
MSGREIPIPWERVYDVHGIRVALRTDSAAVAAGAERALADLPCRSATASGDGVLATVQMDLRAGAVPFRVPEEALPQFRHAQVRCYRHGGELWYESSDATVVLDPESGTAEGHLSPAGAIPSGQWRAQGDAVFTFSLLELLRHRGLFHLHAAGLARDGRGVLLAGNTGAGKSTLTVSLVRAGWDFLSDDAVLLRTSPEGVEALSLPSEFHLDPTLAERFPELAPLADRQGYGSGEKRAFRPVEIYERQPIAACVPSLLLFPQIAPGATRAQTLTPTQALTALIRSSALVLLDERVAAPHLDALKRLVSQCRCYWLYHGPDALEDPTCIPELIEALLGSGTPGAQSPARS